MKFETALGATEGFNGAQCRLGLKTKANQNGKRSGGVDGIVQTWNAKASIQALSIGTYGEGNLGAGGIDRLQANIRVFGLPERDEFLVGQHGPNTHRARVVRTDGNELTRASSKLGELLLEGFEAAVVVQVVWVDVCDQGNRGVVVQERTV